MPRVPHTPRGHLTLGAVAWALYIFPPLLALGVVASGASGLEMIAVGRWGVWVAAECVIAVALVTARNETEALARSVVGQASTMTVTLLVHLLHQVDPFERGCAATLAFVTMVAILGGMSAGAVLAIWQSWLARTVLRVKTCPSHDAVDRVLLAASPRLLAPALAVSAVLLLHDTGFTWIGAPAIALPLSAAIASAARRRALRRWIARVHAGRIPGWRIVERRPAWSDRALQPVTTGSSPSEPARVLVRTRPAAHPFREADADTPVATVG